MKFPVWRRRREEELEEEIQSHLVMAARDRVERGEPAEHAQAAARREFGNVSLVKEVTRGIWGWLWIEQLAQDLRYALRMLRRSPGFTAVAVLSLALGIGANTAIFSLVDEVLLKTLPVQRPEELVLFNWLSGPKAMSRGMSGSVGKDPATGLRTSTSFSYLTFERFRDYGETLAEVFAFAPIQQLNVNVDGQAEIADGQLISGNYYAGLGLRPFQGRTITTADDRAEAGPVAVITYRYWQRRFGLDPAVVGKTVQVNGVPFTIVGITPPGFNGALQVGQSADLSIPIAMEPRLRPGNSNLSQPWLWWVRIMGRLKPGITSDQARGNFEAVFQQSALDGWLAGSGQKEARELRDGPALRVGSGGQGLNELRLAYRQPLMILVAVTGLVLLIACVNIANLVLARGAGRHREIAARCALGAGRWRLAQQLLTESLLLAAIGGMLGAVLAYWGKDLLLTLPTWGGGGLKLELKLDPTVLGFTAAVSILTGLLFGLAPALRATQVDLASALKDDARSLAGGGRSLMARALVVAQVAMSLVLLVGAGLFLRTLSNLESVDAGFNRENLLLFRVDPVLSGYKGAQAAGLYRTMIERIGAVPGVRAVTVSRHPLLSGSSRVDRVTIMGHVPPSESSDVYINVVAPNFFDTMEMPILSGRSLSPRDDELAPKVAVINQVMAKVYFGDENPVGRRFDFGPQTEGKIEIVGVARDARYTGLRAETPPTVYIPLPQDVPPQANFAVRTAIEPGGMIASVRQAVREVDSNLPLFDIKTQSEQAEQSIAQERLFAQLTGAFGLLALLLSAIGLYGVLSYSVARRTAEIGIRMALGAERWDVISMIMRSVMILVLLGVALGLGGALAATRMISGMLYGITPTDPWTIVLAVLVLMAVAMLAGFLPARRASRVDPLAALRYE
jgi:predicted permease